jgi:hypothetical protein
MKLIYREPYRGIKTLILVAFKRALYFTFGKSPHRPYGFITIGTTKKNNKRHGITIERWNNYA